MTDDNLPTEYEKYLEFLEHNTDRMVAEIWENYYVPQSELEPLIEEWRTDPLRTPGECADDLAAVLTDND
jgi:hypothetical protein